ncbi:MAG: DUF5654 family protein [archaeon]|nr:DUF5654 family protein [archaeon]
MNLLQPKRSFKREFKRQIRLAIVAAIGFTIAFAWREVVFDTFQDFIVQFLDVIEGHPLTKMYTAIAITLVGVIAIYASSRLLRD